jgi:hypothetical protein
VYQRPVAELGRSGWLAAIVALTLVGAFEAWARIDQGLQSGDYRNSSGAWAEQRRRIDNGEGDAWVFTGSSRVKFDVQLPVWERLDGKPAIMLAVEGTTPLPAVEGLAEDEDFTGTVVIGVAPGLFFSGFEYFGSAIERYATETPSQWLGHKISVLFEPHLAFYTADFSLSSILGRQPLPLRDGMELQRDVRKLANQDRRRNTRMWDRLEYDPEYRQLAKDIWAEGWVPLAERPEEVRERLLEARQKQIERAVAAVGKLRERGVEAIFAVMPYEGHYAVSEPDIAPRELTWDILLEKTGALGLHFQDHEEMQGYYLAEWSHMTASEADRFTEAFYRLVQRELAARAADGGVP